MHNIKMLSEFYKIVDENPAKAREIIKKLDYKNDHYLLKCVAKTYWDEAKFDKYGNWNKKTDERKLRMAERYIVKAFEIKPTCPDVLWLLGFIRWDYGQIDVAIYCFKEIINLGVSRIVYSGCKNELSVGLAQINDSKFELYRLLYDINPSLSKKYLTSYKKGIAKGVKTLYSPLDNFLLL
jgi:hypothetical protein